MKLLTRILIKTHPVAKQRPRMTKTGRAYTPAKTRLAEKTAAELIKQQFTQAPYSQDLFVIVEAYHKRPQRLNTKRTPPGPVYKKTRPDSDNILKLYADAGNGILWMDDAQIVGSMILDSYAAKDTNPHVIISVYDDLVKPLEIRGMLDGVDYYFKAEAEMKQLKRRIRFLEEQIHQQKITQ